MTTQTHVALFWGITVVGRKKLPMLALVGLFEAAGCAALRTDIQIGIVV